MSALVRLDKLLSNRGYATRREAKSFLKQRRVKAAGLYPESVEQKVAPDDVLIDDEPLDPETLSLLLYKPPGYSCAHDSADSVFALLPERYLRRNPPLSCAGRLDKDVSGALIFSDDGQLVHKIIAPRSKLPKIYRVRVTNALTHADIGALASGELRLRGEKKNLLPADLRIVGEKEGELTIYEGRYHQVKRMFAALGNHVEQLERIKIGNLDLGSLRPGEHRLLSEEDLGLLLEKGYRAFSSK